MDGGASPATAPASRHGASTAAARPPPPRLLVLIMPLLATCASVVAFACLFGAGHALAAALRR